MAPDEVAVQHGLKFEEYNVFNQVLELIAARWPGMMSRSLPFARKYDWVGWYDQAWDPLPFCVVQITDDLHIPLSPD